MKLFRNLRNNILNKGKISKYFKYAIGEIVLVVIGILIALQINNWNENRKTSIEEINILKSLHENLILTKQQSKDLIDEENNLKKLLIGILDKHPINNTEKEVTDLIFKEAVWDLQSNLPTMNTYFNLKNTNQLGKISNKTITEKFTELDFRYSKLTDLLKDRLSVHQIRIDDILENDVNFIPLLKSTVPEINLEAEIATNYTEILKNVRIRNLLGMKLAFTQDIINKRLELDSAIENLLSLVALEIKKHD